MDAPQVNTLINEALEKDERFDNIEYVLDDEVISLIASYFKSRTESIEDLVCDFISMVMYGVSIAEIVEFLDVYDIDLDDTKLLTSVITPVETYLHDFNIPRESWSYVDGIEHDDKVSSFFLVHSYEEDTGSTFVKLTLFARKELSNAAVVQI